MNQPKPGTQSFRAPHRPPRLLPLEILSGKGSPVTPTLLHENIVESSESLLLRDTLPDAAWAQPGPELCDQSSNLDLASEAVVEEENVPRAILAGACIEIVLGLGLYAVWHAVHLAR